MVKVVIGASMRRYLLHRPSRTMPLRARWSDFRFGVADPAGETEPVGAAVRRSQRLECWTIVQHGSKDDDLFAYREYVESLGHSVATRRSRRDGALNPSQTT